MPATDSSGSARGPNWPRDRLQTLQDEVDLLRPLVQRAGSPFVLVSHFYGGAVALTAALRRPPGLRVPVLCEPTLFGLLDAESSPLNEAEGIRRTVAEAATLLAAGPPGAAAGRFVDFWMGPGSWERMPVPRREGESSRRSSTCRAGATRCSTGPHCRQPS